MVCQHCNARIEGAATTCAACGKPVSRRRPKSARRTRTRNSVQQTPESSASPDLPEVSSTGTTVPAVLSDQTGNGDPSTRTALALAPQTLPVPFIPAGASTKIDSTIAPRKRRLLLRALAFGGVLAAILVFALGGSEHGSDQTASHNMTVPESAVADNRTTAAQPAASALPPATKRIVAASSNVSTKKAVSTTSKESMKTAGAATAARADKQRIATPGKSQPAQIAKAPKTTAAPARSAATEHPTPIVLASKAPIAQDLYSQCLELGNFLRQEQCKWQVCSGKWGQNGCPSYKKDDVEVNY